MSIENCGAKIDESQNLCQICKKSFKQIGNLKRHIINIHEKNSGYPCPYCDKIYFDSKEKLISHKNSEHLLHQCELCEKSFKFSHALTRHIRQIHKGGEGVKKYTCDFCGWLFYEKTKVLIKSIYFHVIFSEAYFLSQFHDIWPHQLCKKLVKETIFNIWRNEKYFSVLLIYQLFGYNFGKI